MEWQSGNIFIRATTLPKAGDVTKGHAYGPSAMVKIAALAKAFGVRLVPHDAYFGAGYLAWLHVNAALAPDALFERLFVDLEASPYHELVEAKGGEVTIPQARPWVVSPIWRCSDAIWCANRQCTPTETSRLTPNGVAASQPVLAVPAQRL